MRHTPIDPLDVLRGLHGPVRDRVADASQLTGVPVERIMSRRRTFHVSRARHYAMWLMRQDGMSFPAIADALGVKNHSSVVYGIRRIESELAERGLSHPTIRNSLRRYEEQANGY